jgi:hypothetical protein
VKKILYILPFVLLALASCNIQDLDIANLEGPTITSETSIPLGHTAYTIRELIEDMGSQANGLEEDSDSKLIFRYRDTISFAAGTDFIQIPAILDTIKFMLPTINAPVADSVVVIQQSFKLPYQPQKNERLDEIYYKAFNAGNVTFSLKSSQSNTYTATVVSTTKVSDGTPIKFTESSASSFELDGYKSVFIPNNGQNEFQVDLNMSIPLNAGQGIAANQEVEMIIGFDNQEFSMIKGYFGQDTVSLGSQVMNIDFFQTIGKSGFTFNNPEFKFTFTNGFGIPLSMDFGTFFGLSGTNTTFLAGKITNTLQILPSADETTGTAGVLNTSINYTNSTIRTLLSSAPEKIGIGLETQTNIGNTTIQNFLYDTSSISTYVEAILPLSLSLKNVTRDIGFSLGGGLKFNETDSLILRIITVNEIPFSSTFDLEVWDANDSVIYRTENHQALETPFLNFDGSLKQARKNIEDVPISEAGIKAMNIGSKLNFKVTISTPTSENSKDIFVDILADYKLDIQISASGTLKVNL